MHAPHTRPPPLRCRTSGASSPLGACRLLCGWCEAWLGTTLKRTLALRLLGAQRLLAQLANEDVDEGVLVYRVHLLVGHALEGEQGGEELQEARVHSVRALLVAEHHCARTRAFAEGWGSLHGAAVGESSRKVQAAAMRVWSKRQSSAQECLKEYLVCEGAHWDEGELLGHKKNLHMLYVQSKGMHGACCQTHRHPQRIPIWGRSGASRLPQRIACRS